MASDDGFPARRSDTVASIGFTDSQGRTRLLRGVRFGNGYKFQPRDTDEVRALDLHGLAVVRPTKAKED